MLIAAGAIVATSGGTAYADTTCNPNIGHHCWERLNLQGKFIGDSVYPKSSCLVVTSPSAAAVTNETWMLNGSYWVEAGQAYGYPVGGRRYYYWADQRPGHSYSEHDDTSSSTPSLGTGYLDYIDQASSTSYFAESGPWSGTSTGWASGYTFASLQTGTETFDDGEEVAERGESYNLAYFNTPSNAVHNGWTYGTNKPTKSPDPTDWGSISTVSRYSAYDINATSTCTLGATATQHPATPKRLKTANVASFKREATADAGRRPYTAVWTATTADAAENLLYGSFSTDRSAAGLDATEPVMVLAATGTRFTARRAKAPVGSALPTGTVLTEVIDLTTGLVRDWGVSDKDPGLARLGVVNQLPQ